VDEEHSRFDDVRAGLAVNRYVYAHRNFRLCSTRMFVQAPKRRKAAQHKCNCIFLAVSSGSGKASSASVSNKSLGRYTADRRELTIAWYSTKTTIPPMKATRMLHRLKPVTP
jgi:hypothetical protein